MAAESLLLEAAAVFVCAAFLRGSKCIVYLREGIKSLERCIGGKKYVRCVTLTGLLLPVICSYKYYYSW